MVRISTVTISLISFPNGAFSLFTSGPLRVRVCLLTSTAKGLLQFLGNLYMLHQCQSAYSLSINPLSSIRRRW